MTDCKLSGKVPYVMEDVSLLVYDLDYYISKLPDDRWIAFYKNNLNNIINTVSIYKTFDSARDGINEFILKLKRLSLYEQNLFNS